LIGIVSRTVFTVSCAAGLGVRTDVPGAHHSQQQGRQLHAQRRGDGQDERLQARRPEEVAVLEAQLHVLAAELRGLAGRRLSDHEVRRPTPSDAAAALDHV